MMLGANLISESCFTMLQVYTFIFLEGPLVLHLFLVFEILHIHNFNGSCF